MIEGIDGEENDASRVEVTSASPLKVMFSSVEEGRTDETFPKCGEGSVIGLVDKGT